MGKSLSGKVNYIHRGIAGYAGEEIPQLVGLRVRPKGEELVGTIYFVWIDRENKVGLVGVRFEGEKGGYSRVFFDDNLELENGGNLLVTTNNGSIKS